MFGLMEGSGMEWTIIGGNCVPLYGYEKKKKKGIYWNWMDHPIPMLESYFSSPQNWEAGNG